MMSSKLSSVRVLAIGLLFTACTGGGAPAESGPKKTDSKPVAAGPAAPALPNAEQLLADSVQAMGGADKFAGFKNFYAESSMNMGALGLKGVARTWWRDGDFYNETEMSGVGQMKIGGLGGKAWADDPISGLRALTGKEAEQAMWSATLCLAHDWKRYFPRADTTAVKEVDGKKLAEITFTSALGDKVVLRIDLESKLPVSQSFEQASPMGSMPATVYFKDYREIAGVKIPYQQDVDASLTKAVTTTTKLEFNTTVDESKFVMPGASQAVTPGALVDPAKVDPMKVEPAKVEPEKTKPTRGKQKPAAG